MKTFRISIFIIILPFFVYCDNHYPIVLVHGFLGWGNDEVGEINYWGGKNDIKEYLLDKGFTVFSVSLGPVSSTYDCAIETYYQIKGGQVDYGIEHSKKYGIVRKPKGKYYEGLYPEWDANHPIHLLGYSFGGLTARMLLSLLDSTYIDKVNNKLGESNLLSKSHKNWVRSITTMSTPHNGATLSNIVIDALPFTDNLLPIANIVSTQYYDFDLDHWNLSKNENESIRQYINRFINHPAWNTKNSIAWDSSIQGARELNNHLTINQDVYYFSSSTVASVLDTLSGNHKPADHISSMSYPWSWLIGRTKVSIDSEEETDSSWFKNDGTVNTISMKHPFTGKLGPEPVKEFSKSDELRPGIWYHLGEYNYDHKSFLGHFLDDSSKIKNIMKIFEKHAGLLYSLP